MAGLPSRGAVAPDRRIASIDILRGIALFGVLIVNLETEFRVSIFQQFLGTGPEPVTADAFVERLVSLVFESKAFCLFAFLFGVGLAIQYERLSRHGHPLYWLFRRLVVLLALGLIHLLLIWNGDILTEYAIAGLVVLPLLALPARVLAAAAIGLLALHVAGPAFLYSVPWPDAAALRQHVDLAGQAYASGSFAEILRFSFRELPLILALHAFVFPRTLALFLLGALAWRVGLFRHLHDGKTAMAIAAFVSLAAGVALHAAKGPIANLAPVLLALSYGAAILWMTQLERMTRPLNAFAPLGRMAFTNYLAQSIAFALVFFGYGLGQFGRMSAVPALVLGVAVYVAQMLFSAWWLRRYRFGPVEWLWRTLMYGAPQPMRIRPTG